ncbi:response regulator [Treponema phagedenis]|nr:response regulator [Treponema phagedenis]QEJ96496.1 response regulator [Treponema phagedenis]QEJ99646.1 response regulator [Treponema phagedenis]QEK05197.1 response regulator [Treponema phagedenis]QEK10820.1 response regulator [Treponema phagedenis]QSH93691.1 helix-turn-helix domain-containing protein [Treponema phagedenis]
MFSALEVADMCGVVNQTAINWIRNGYLKAFNTPGGQYRVYKEDFLDFIKERGMKIPEGLLDEEDVPHWNSLIIIDDDKGLNDGIAAYLRKHIPSLTLYQSFDGFDAGAQLVQHKVGLILLDLDLPGVGGKQICAKIKSEPSFGDPYVMVITALDDEDIEEEMLSIGADKFFRKPLDFKDILNEINNLIE